MKVLKASVVLVAAAIMLFGAYGTSYAFHDGGVAYCEGCHTMHNSVDNTAPKIGKSGITPFLPAVGTQFNGRQYLLRGSDQGSTCLNCHAAAAANSGSYHIMTNDASATVAPTNLTPGGDFGWIKIGNLSAVATYGAPVSNKANRRGHNVIARDFGLDSTIYSGNPLSVSPGGNYPASSLYCNSCHDPHSQTRQDASGNLTNRSVAGTQVAPIIGSGSYYDAVPVLSATANGGAGEAMGVYRFLGGIGYKPESGGAATAFTANAPIAMAPTTYNRSEATGDTRVVYGTGMSEWCANCHASIHNTVAAYDGGTVFEHPASSDSKLSTNGQDAIYNEYIYSGNLKGVQATAYTSMVPIETGAASASAIASFASTTANLTMGADTNSNVMCLSCHRAHASAWPSMLRWNATSAEFLTIDGAYPGTDGATADQRGGQYNLGYTQAQVQKAFYDRPATQYASYQRSLCNKCHAKD